MAYFQWHTGIVVRIIEATWNTRRYFIKINNVDRFDFIAGQFVVLDLPIGEKPAQRWRSYSIASCPDGGNIIELLIVLLEGGAGSNYIFNEIREGSEFILRGPHGFFTLPAVFKHDLFFICTGTGIAPFRSMLYYIIERKLTPYNIYLVYGCRTQKDLLYYEEMMTLHNRIPQFHYIPTLSREQWYGKTGYVHEHYKEICLSHCKTDTPLAQSYPATFYLCGWKFMIEDAKRNILQMGYDRRSVKSELYG